VTGKSAAPARITCDMGIYQHLSAPTSQQDNFRLADQLDRATVVIDNGGLATVVQPMGH
jgi:hypothetical protein